MNRAVRISFLKTLIVDQIKRSEAALGMGRKKRGDAEEDRAGRKAAAVFRLHKLSGARGAENMAYRCVDGLASVRLR